MSIALNRQCDKRAVRQKRGLLRPDAITIRRIIMPGIRKRIGLLRIPVIAVVLLVAGGLLESVLGQGEKKDQPNTLGNTLLTLF
jgi:hypothetical protein